MDISLSPDNEKFIQNQIAAGIYNSLNEAINATISIAISQVIDSKSQLDLLNAEIQRGIDDYNEGRYLDGELAFKKLMAKYE
ncbi:MAG: hypothetical protein IJ681_00095 [Bacteroidales bacterium]|nr:hypothetical protein [Bacteroidales bacterium]